MSELLIVCSPLAFLAAGFGLRQLGLATAQDGLTLLRLARAKKSFFKLIN